MAAINPGAPANTPVDNNNFPENPVGPAYLLALPVVIGGRELLFQHMPSPEAMDNVNFPADPPVPNLAILAENVQQAFVNQMGTGSEKSGDEYGY